MPLKYSKLSTIKLFMISLIMLLLTSCGFGGGNSQIPSIEGRVSPTFDGPSELAFCSTPLNYGSSVTITGTATYQEREAFDLGGGNNGLGGPSAARPIRYAEVRVLDSSGNVIQCAETNNTGNFSFQVPPSSATHTLQINSRVNNNSIANASVLRAPETNDFYSLTKSFTADTNNDIGNLNAPVTGEILGAAFHILDLIIKANEFLRAEAGSCSSAIVGCNDFVVAPKVSIYWERGYNPNSYLGFPSSGLSFYLPNYSRLFILGGVSGDTDTKDTDHFDDTIILHEYGHFLEDLLSKSDSPGGAHSGQRPIDPRLALSEAWGNFLQAAIIYGPSNASPAYIDTRGNIDGNTGFLLSVPLETASSSCGVSPNIPGCDIPSVAGEGNYREFAISRFFWDIFDTVNDSESVSGGFNEVWASITSGNGYLQANKRFRSIGLVNLLQDDLSDGVSSPVTDWSVARGLAQNRVSNDRFFYGQYLTTGSSCGVRNFNIVPYDDPFEDDGNVPIINGGLKDEFYAPNLFHNSHFYHFIQLSNGPANIELRYQTPSGTESDLDLYLYNESANFGFTPDMEAKDESSPTTAGSGNIETQVLNIPNLEAGHYLINVKVETVNRPSVGDSTDYELYSGGSQLCPTALP